MPRNTWIRLCLRVCTGVVGASFLALTFLVGPLGLDPSPGWGRYRVGLFGVGLLFVAIALWKVLEQPVLGVSQQVGSLLQSAWSWIAGTPMARAFHTSLILPARRAWQRLADHFALQERSQRAHARLERWRAKLLATSGYASLFGTSSKATQTVSWLIVAVTLIVYAWLISAGRWTDWPASKSYYDMLASAFGKGQIHLLEEPSNALLALDNPYDIAQREGVDYLWDVSLYQGQYYLYWGPVPALLLVPLKLAGASPIHDGYLVLLFAAGAHIFTALFLLAIWRRFYGNLAWWTPLPPILASGLANPLPWLLTRPEIYEAAIAGGALFFMGGLYWAFTGLASDRLIPWRLALGGLFLGLAVGTRSSLTLAVAFCALAVVMWILSRLLGPGSRRATLKAAGAFAVPLLLVAGSLAVYNYARFDDVLEFGHKFQLGRPKALAGAAAPFSLDYLFVNSYNYLMNPANRLSVFPYVKPNSGRTALPLPVLGQPADYRVEKVTGLLNSVPFLWLSLLSVTTLSFLRSQATTGSAGDGSSPAWWLWCCWRRSSLCCRC